MTTLSRRIEAILFTRDEAVSEALLAQALARVLDGELVGDELFDDEATARRMVALK